MKYLMYANFLVIAVMLAVYIWAAFDLHNRIHYAMLSQIPPLVFMAIRRALR